MYIQSGMNKWTDCVFGVCDPVKKQSVELKLTKLMVSTEYRDVEGSS